MRYAPHFTITTTLLARVEAVAALRERIQTAAVQVAWIPALQKETRARNAHASTAIDGNPLTLEQVRAVEAGEALAVPTRVRREVVNYFAALRHAEKQAAKKRLTHEDVLRLHAIIAGSQDDVVGLIAGRAQGVTMPNLNTGVMSSVPEKLPPRKYQDDFARLTFPMAQSREALTAKIDNLRRTRNLLLPRLLSGQVSLS